MKHLFIINPTAGGKKVRADELESEIRAFSENLGDNYEIYLTKAPMDACIKVAQEAKTEDMLRVYACGGDGTLNECANGAANCGNVAITHYPCGTGNDFIRMFGEENARKFRDLRALTSGSVHPLDLIECNGRYSINICSVGIDARIGTDVHKYSNIPVIGGAAGYVVSLAVNLIKGVTQNFRISAGEDVLEGKFALVCACNGRFYGGGFNPAPDAMPDDQIIEYLIVKDISRMKFIRIVGKYAKGRFRELSDVITHFRGNRVDIEAAREFVVNIDGEAIYAKNVSFKLIPNGVNFIIPAGMDFFSKNT